MYIGSLLCSKRLKLLRWALRIAALLFSQCIGYGVPVNVKTKNATVYNEPQDMLPSHFVCWFWSDCFRAFECFVHLSTTVVQRHKNILTLKFRFTLALHQEARDYSGTISGEYVCSVYTNHQQLKKKLRWWAL